MGKVNSFFSDGCFMSAKISIFAYLIASTKFMIIVNYMNWDKKGWRIFGCATA
jgi:hypothetical protein